MLMVMWCHSECWVPSGLDFEAGDGSVARCCVSNKVLRGHRIVNIT